MKPMNIAIVIVLIVGLSGLVLRLKSSDQTGVRMDVPGYLEYSEAVLSTARLKGNSVLFFAAIGWCQTCSALEKEILERRDEVPSDVTILKVDYDHDKKMNARHGVVMQHTMIALDRDGNEIKRWVGGGMDTLLQELRNI